jgi:hypothetical protein
MRVTNPLDSRSDLTEYIAEALVPKKPYKPTICIDFDGVLHGYSEGWKGGEIYDDPVKLSRETLFLLQSKFNLVVSTARQDVESVWRWLKNKGYPEMDVTNSKPIAVLYIDDRGYRFTSWLETLSFILDRLEELSGKGIDDK